jgi:hypothetical protein
VKHADELPFFNDDSRAGLNRARRRKMALIARARIQKL